MTEPNIQEASPKASNTPVILASIAIACDLVFVPWSMGLISFQSFSSLFPILVIAAAALSITSLLLKTGRTALSKALSITALALSSAIVVLWLIVLAFVAAIGGAITSGLDYLSNNIH